MSIKKYKRGDLLFYTPDGWPNSLKCEVLISTLEPGGGNLETATLVIKADKMGHPITIPVLDQDDYLSEVSTPATVKKPSLLSRLFGAVILLLIAFAPAANGQNKEIPVVFSPRIKSALETGEQIDPPKVLGIFKNERRAGFWLTLGGAAGMAGGAILQGRAAYLIQTHGHGGDWDNYELTRTSGLSLQVLGAAAYGGGFVYRSKSWYKKRPWLWGSVEAVGWFVASKYISEAAYRGRGK